MFTKILVPLDGSKRAESALPVVARIARASGGSIVLLRVALIPKDYSRYMGVDSMPASYALSVEVPSAQEVIDREVYTAKSYLRKIATSDMLAGITTETKVLVGSVAQSIISTVQAAGVDLITICSHGYSGLKRWMIGSVAQKVARHSPVPVLVLRESAGIPTNLHPDGMRPVRVLVALDGSALSEISLAPAAQLSATLSAPDQGALHLVQVIHFPELEGDGQYGTISETRKLAVSTAQAYLTTVKERLTEGDLAPLNLQVTSSVVTNTDVANTLIGMAELGEGMEVEQGFNGCDMIAMATHGRGGPERWVVGSVTERVLDATKLPLLIVRSHKLGSKGEEVEISTDTGNTRSKAAASMESWVGLL
jgi:nucleotide-binding universal stress UspA family protein